MICNFNEGWLEDNIIYGSCRNMNALFSFDLKNRSLNFECTFEHDYSLTADLHSKVLKKGEELIFIPFNGKGMSHYDLAKKRQLFTPTSLGFVNAVEYKDKIFLIPVLLSNGIWEYIPEAKELKKTKFINTILLEQHIIKATTDWYGSIIVDNFLYIVCFDTEYILCINLDTGKNKILTINSTNLDNISYYGGWYYITDVKKACIYKIKMNENIHCIGAQENSIIRPIYRTVMYNEKIICIPCFGDNIYQYDPKLDRIDNIYKIPPYNRIDTMQTKYSGVLYWKDKLLILPKGETKIIEFDGKDVETYEISYNEHIKLNHNNGQANWMIENGIFDLSEYIRML